MTKDNLYNSSVADFRNKNKYILTLKRRADMYISSVLLGRQINGIVDQKKCFNEVFNIMGINTRVADELLFPHIKKYIEKLVNVNDFQHATVKYYNNFINCIEEFEKHKGSKLYISHFNTREALMEFNKFLAEKRQMNNNSIKKRLMEKSDKLTTPRRFKLTTSGRSKLTTSRRSKLTT
jgi:hypothetical protein